MSTFSQIKDIINYQHILTSLFYILSAQHLNAGQKKKSSTWNHIIWQIRESNQSPSPWMKIHTGDSLQGCEPKPGAQRPVSVDIYLYIHRSIYSWAAAILIMVLIRSHREGNCCTKVGTHLWVYSWIASWASLVRGWGCFGGKQISRWARKSNTVESKQNWTRS